MASGVLFTLGARGSPLALAQAREARRAIAAAHGWEEGAIAIASSAPAATSSKTARSPKRAARGCSPRRSTRRLLEGRIDAAVHSAKDLPTRLPEGVAIAGFLEREDVRDALISALADSIVALPRGARLGAASLRRQAQALRLRPDLRVELLRGNVETRLGKAEASEIDATLLALAGLKRLGLAHRARAILDIETFLPAVGQGAVALTARSRDARASAALAPIGHAETLAALTAERAFLAELEGSCRTPIAGYARLEAGALVLTGQALRVDGSESFDVRLTGAAADAARLGAEAGRDLKRRLPPGVLPAGEGAGSAGRGSG